jgi:hypothetical protein
MVVSSIIASADLSPMWLQPTEPMATAEPMRIAVKRFRFHASTPVGLKESWM